MQPIDHFFRAARAAPSSVAARCGVESLAYGALAHRVRALAAGLQAIDPEPGSRVGICCRNSLEHLAAFLATLAAGKTWVPLFHRNTADEIARAVAFTGASVVIAEEETRAKVAGAGARIVLADAASLAADSTGGMAAAFHGRGPARVVRDLADTQAIKFTGGTTGTPKGVMQPLRAWNTAIATQILTWRLGPEDAFLAGAPITHGTSTYLLPFLAVGARIEIVDQPRPEDTLEALGSGRITATFVPPTVIYMMMERAGGADGLDFSRLRHLIYGAGPMRPDAIGRAQALFGPVIASTYGQTEAPQIATAITGPELAREDRRATVGRPTLLTQVEVLSDDGEILPPGETGEVAIRGDLVMTGFWREPERTAEAFRNGWLMTGDLGAFDEDGYLTLRGRRRDVVITGGFNVYPSEVEPVIGAHAAVADCAVFGVPDEKWGEAVEAAVVLAPGASVEAEELVRLARERLGPVKAPKSIHFLKELPRNAYGKLQKGALTEMAAKVRNDTRAA